MVDEIKIDAATKEAGKSREDKIIEEAENLGIDLVAFIGLQGKKKSRTEMLIDEIFEDEQSRAFKLKVQVFDVFHNEALLERERSFDEIGDARQSFKKMLSDLNYPYLRGRIFKVEGEKAAVNFGLEDGIEPGSKVEVYKAAPKVKIGKNEIRPLGKSVGQAEVIKVISNASLIQSTEEKELKENYYVEAKYLIAKDGGDKNSSETKDKHVSYIKTENLSKIKEEEKKNNRTYNFGFDLGWPFYGLGFVYWPNQHGFGINYFQSTSNYGSSSSSANTTHLSCRYYYSIKPDMYLSAGVGQYTDTGWGYYGENYVESLWALLLGVKAGENIAYEFGYGSKSANYYSYSSGTITLGMKISTGF